MLKRWPKLYMFVILCVTIVVVIVKNSWHHARYKERHNLTIKRARTLVLFKAESHGRVVRHAAHSGEWKLSPEHHIAWLRKGCGSQRELLL